MGLFGSHNYFSNCLRCYSIRRTASEKGKFLLTMVHVEESIQLPRDFEGSSSFAGIDK